MLLRIEDIKEIKKVSKGYEIVFNDGNYIWLTKRRTIIALLMLIKYEVSSEADLARGSLRLQEVQQILAGRYDPTWINKEGYGDANKPFSELWNEEGFTWIQQHQQSGRGSKQYKLEPSDHYRFFTEVRKAFRKSLSISEQTILLQEQKMFCNLCGSRLSDHKSVYKDGRIFFRDRVRQTFDHRVPVEKGGDSTPENFQALCFACNKSKWQICNICDLPNCSENCALAFPENSNIVAPTGEDITDRLNRGK